MAAGLLILQFEQTDDGAEDLEFRHEMEELAEKCLEASDLGECDGGDIGSGTMNIFCHVTDPERACRAIVDALASAGVEGAVIAFVEDAEVETADPRVLWPKDFAGTFRVL